MTRPLRFPRHLLLRLVQDHRPMSEAHARIPRRLRSDLEKLPAEAYKALLQLVLLREPGEPIHDWIDGFARMWGCHYDTARRTIATLVRAGWIDYVAGDRLGRGKGTGQATITVCRHECTTANAVRNATTTPTHRDHNATTSRSHRNPNAAHTRTKNQEPRNPRAGARAVRAPDAGAPPTDPAVTASAATKRAARLAQVQAVLARLDDDPALAAAIASDCPRPLATLRRALAGDCSPVLANHLDRVLAALPSPIRAAIPA